MAVLNAILALTGDADVVVATVDDVVLVEIDSLELLELLDTCVDELVVGAITELEVVELVWATELAELVDGTGSG